MMKWIVVLLAIWTVWMVLRKPARAAIAPDIASARRLLGVGAKADEATVRAAHRRLLAEAHPDRGGSAEEARALNAARDLLLNRGA